jgi:hypothetical protein
MAYSKVKSKSNGEEARTSGIENISDKCLPI